MASKLNPILVNSLLALLFGLLTLWFFYAHPMSVKILADEVGVVLSYPEKPAEELRMLVQAASNWVMERQSLHDRNRELEIENLKLRAALQRATAPVLVSTDTLIGARVILRYPDAWWKEIRVDKGARDGVQIGAPALSDGYMIGRVIRVGETYAWIELVTSSSFMLAAVIEETWDLGVINGDDMGNIWLMYAPPEKEYTRGMIVSTALVGDYLPPGIPIGKIWGAGEVRDGYTPQMVASGAHLTQLYNVQILHTGNEPQAKEGALP